MEERSNRFRDVLVGTSGYSYVEWIDAGFYPRSTPQKAMLPLYRESFRATELNYTWYQMPKAEPIERMCARVDSGFRFAVKLTRTMTHEVVRGRWRKEVKRYREGLDPLVRSGKLLAVLIQFPFSFYRSIDHRNYLAALVEELAGLPLAVEFRHDSWACDPVFAEFEKRGITLVTVDMPPLAHLFPCLDVVTNPGLAYLRFHGRNVLGWGSGSMQRQFDYDYSDDELAELLERVINPMAAKADTSAFFFNNHVRGQAPKNARTLIPMLSGQSGQGLAKGA
ncbi:MAG: DUF72 domain-containing protein [Desulfobacteraceae bacterium]|nr:DUF72 domain-containing protein [Desulfobacteraceae bacterium]